MESFVRAFRHTEPRLFELRVLADGEPPPTPAAAVLAVAYSEPDARRFAEAAMHFLRSAGPADGAFLDSARVSCEDLGRSESGDPVGSVSVVPNQRWWVRRWPNVLIGSPMLH